MRWRTWIRRIVRGAMFPGLCVAWGGMDGFYYATSPVVLPHATYQIHGMLVWHRVFTGGQTFESRFPWMSGFRLGLFDRGEFGMEYGEAVSLSGKVQFMQEEDWLPAWAFGARSVFAAQEAHLKSVPDTLRHLYEGEIYTTAAKTFFSGATSLVGGISVFSAMDSGSVSLFWGVAQSLGNGFSALYDGYRLRGDIHHQIALQWSFRDALRLSAGLTEFNRWFYQGEKFGLFTRDEQRAVNSGLRSPGIFMQISLIGLMRNSGAPSTQARLSALEKKLSQHARRVEFLEEKMDRVEMQLSGLRGDSGDSLALADTRAERLLAEIVRGMQMDAWDARLVRQWQDSLLAMGESARRLLARVAQRESSAPEYRLVSIRIMGNSRNPYFAEILLRLLDSESLSIQRETLLALGKIGTSAVANGLKEFRGRAPQELIALTDEIIQAVQGTTHISPPPAPPLP